MLENVNIKSEGNTRMGWMGNTLGANTNIQEDLDKLKPESRNKYHFQ